MHRIKIGLIAAGVLLVSTVLVSSAVTSRLREAGIQRVESEVMRSAQLYQRINRLEAIDFAGLVADQARDNNLRAATAAADETERRRAAFIEAEAINARLGKEGRRADIVAVLDQDGKVIARDLNANAMYGEDLKAKYPAVGAAMQGQPTRDIWNLSGRMTRVAIAPIQKDDGTLGGALVIGYVMSSQGARSMREQLGADVGLFHQGRVQTSSFMTPEGKEEGNKTQALTGLLFSGDKLAEKALTGDTVTEVQHVTLDGTEYAAVATPLAGNLSDKSSGVVVLKSLEGPASDAAALATWIWIIGLLGILVAVLAAGLTARRFVRPLDEVELGVAEIINGNIDYTFKPVGPDFEGLSNGLNVMLGRLLGREELDEDQVEEEDGKKWKAEQMIIDEGDGHPAGSNPQALAQESEAAYYPRLFNEYITALRNAGVRADGVSVQAFTAKLRLAEGGLRRKWNCRLVRFQIAASGEKILFQAVRID